MYKKIYSCLYLLLGCVSELYAQNYGLCTSEVVPVRAKTSDHSEQVTQLLFGDAFKILKTSENKQWVFIENSSDHYQGWIRRKESTTVSQTYFEAYEKQEHPVSANIKGYIFFKKQKVTVPIGSTLPFYADGFIKIGEEKVRFEGEAKNINTQEDSGTLLQTANKYLNSPYLWGGKSPKGLDCSGFTQMVFKQNGYYLPRDSYQQAEKGELISLADLAPGDLVFFAKTREKDARIVHVGIFIGDGKIIHSYENVHVDRLSKKGDLDKYKRYFKFAKRIL